MSDASNVPPTPPYGADPKAAAKAAKAYAKAQRKWFQKKRWWAAIALVAIIAIAASSNSGGSGPTVVSDGSKTPSGAATGAAKPGTKGNPVKVGTTVELEGTRYTVKKVTTAKTLGANAFSSGTKANGTFVVVTLTIENMKSETKTFLANAAKVIAGNGSSYDTDDSGTTAAIMGDAKPLILEDMQPQLPKTGILVFDVPPTALKGSVLQVSDLFGNGSAYIALGLK